jgi:hypothetical protein
VEHEDPVADIYSPVVVGVGGVKARGSRARGEQVLQYVNRISNVQATLSVTVAAPEGDGSRAAVLVGAHVQARSTRAFISVEIG